MAGFGAKVDMVRTHASSAAPTAPLRPSLCSAVPPLCPTRPSVVCQIPSSVHEVARNSIWREHVGKELKDFQPGGHFQIFDPNRSAPRPLASPAAPRLRFILCRRCREQKRAALFHSSLSRPPGRALPRAEESRSLALLSLSPSWPSAAESGREPLSSTPLSRSLPLSPAHSRVPRAVATVEHKPPMATRLPALPGTPPTPRTMSARQATSRENMRSTQQFMSTFKGTTQQPRERYGRPQTSSHDVGWDARPLTPRNPRFQANRRMCAETVYANKYTMMTGIGPYSPR